PRAWRTPHPGVWVRTGVTASITVLADNLPPALLVQDSIRPHHDFDAVVALVAECPVSLGRLIQRQAMGNQKGRVYLAALYSLQEWPQITVHVRLARLERQRLVHERPERDFVGKAAID